MLYTIEIIEFCIGLTVLLTSSIVGEYVINKVASEAEKFGCRRKYLLK